MAKLEFYRQQTTPRVIAPDVGGLGRIQSGIAQAGEAIARGAVAAGQMIERRNLEIEKRREDEAAIDASSKSVELASRWMEEEQRLQKEAEDADDFDGFSDKATARYQELVNEYLPNIKSDKARAWFTERASIQGLDVQKSSSVFQARSSVAKTVRTESETFNASRRLVQVDPSKFSEASESLKLSASRIEDKQAAAKFYDQNRAILAQDAGIAAANKNPQQVLKALEKPPGQTGFAYLDALDADSVDNVKAAAERRIAIMEQERRAREAEARDKLSSDIDDQLAAISVGIIPEKPFSRAQFAAAGIANKYEDYRKIYDAGATIISLSTMPRSEAAAKIEAMRPTQQKGAAGDLKRYEMVSESYARMVKAQEDDPGGYIMQRNPAVSQAYNAIGAAQTPQEQRAASERFVNMIDSEARRIGIENRSILPKAIADDIINRTYSRDPRDGAVIGSAVILQEKNRWGDKAWKKIFPQLIKELPGSAVAIGAGMREGPANRLIELSQIKEDDFNKLLPSGTSPKDVKNSISDAFQQIEASFYGQAGDSETKIIMQDAIYRLAVDYIRAGKGLNSAVEQAYQEVVGERYNLAEVDDATIRIPKLLDGKPITVSNSELRTGLRDFKNEATKELGFGVVRGSYWQTMQNDQVVILMKDGQPVERPGKEPSYIVYSWQEIKNRAATRSSVGERRAERLLESSKTARGFAE